MKRTVNQNDVAMKQFVEIDGSTETGKSLIKLLKDLSDKNDEIKFRNLDDIEKELDDKLGEKIKEGLKDEDVSKEDIMHTLRE